MKSKVYKKKAEVLTSVVAGMSKNMAKMENKIADLEKQNLRKNVVFTGFYSSDDPMVRISQLQDFCKQTLNVEISIENLYFLGNKQPKPVVVSLATKLQKGNLLQAAKLLKDYRNRDGKKYFICSQEPAELGEIKRRERDIYNRNKLSTAQKVEMSFFKGGLKIANETYRKKVKAPEPSDILQLSTLEIDQILQIKLTKGTRITASDSSFEGYTICAQLHSEIRNAYMKLKLICPQASSIVCAYIIPGMEVYNTQDFWDDGEVAAGRTLLQAMKDSNISSRAIFVARYMGKEKLGQNRFAKFLEAAKISVNKSPPNSYTQSADMLTWNMSFPAQAQVQRVTTNIQQAEQIRATAPNSTSYARAASPPSGYALTSYMSHAATPPVFRSPSMGPRHGGTGP